MPKIDSIDHLTEYRRKLKAARDPKQPTVLVCGGPGCLPLGSEEVAEAFKSTLAEKGLERQGRPQDLRLPGPVRQGG